MKIDLSGVDIFESDELELDKKITFIFGKNGTGKSTITEEFRKLDSDYEVSIFQGFNNIIDENHRLNAVVLGEENSIISRQIDEKNKEIEVKKEEINKLKETLSKPEEENVANFWTRRNDAQIAYQVAEKRLDDFYVQSASAIKNKKNPQVSVTSYNKRNFRDDLESASLLQEDEKKELLATISSEAKKAPEIIFPEEDMEKLLDDINNVLRKTVTERVKVQRIENNPEKREFAKQGINLHKKGEICAFCGSKIKDGVFDELESYFSADEVKKFQTEIISQIEIIDSIIKNVSNIQVSTSDFYPTYVKEAEKIKGEIDGVKKSYLEFLNKLRSALDDKQKYLFEEREKIKEDVPENFVNIVAKYKALQKSNNENDIETKKKEAIIKMRRHYVKELMDDFDYASKKAKADILLAEKNQREKEYNDENSKIVGSHGLEKSIASIRAEIIDLQNQTKNETLLAKNINNKLLHMVSFELEHFEDAESKGFYKIKNSSTGKVRDITELSTGEKNIIAFLYFLEKLSEVKEIPLNKPRLIVFDDPMNSNDDGMQYLIIEELQTLMNGLLKTDHFVLLTHNKHFYLNVKYRHSCKKDKFIRFQSDGIKTKIKVLTKDEEDFKTSYESLWSELKLLYDYDITSADLLLNPIRRIIETFTKFNAVDKTVFCDRVSGAKKLFDVNSHSIDDIEAELNGKTKQEIIQMFYDCFAKNGYGEHFLTYWKEASVDENGILITCK
jgi:wobble nucleotide-excising tRNase